MQIKDRRAENSKSKAISRPIDSYLLVGMRRKVHQESNLSATRGQF